MSPTPRRRRRSRVAYPLRLTRPRPRPCPRHHHHGLAEIWPLRHGAVALTGTSPLRGTGIHVGRRARCLCKHSHAAW